MGLPQAADDCDPEVCRSRPSVTTIEEPTKCSSCGEKVCRAISLVCDACSPHYSPSPNISTPEFPQSITVSTTHQSNGLFVSASIGTWPFSCLIDTGSAASFLNLQTWNTIAKNLQNHTLSSVACKVTSVDGSELTVLGCIQMSVSLSDQCSVHHTFIVADIQPQAILGLDFFRLHHASIHVGENLLYVDDKPISLSPMSSCSTKRIPVRYVKLSCDVVIPGYSQTITPVNVNCKGRPYHYDAVLEPRDRLLQRKSVAVSPVAVQVLPEWNKIPVRVQNLDPTPVTLYKGTIVGELLACTVIDSDDQDEPLSCKAVDVVSEDAIPAELFDLSLVPQSVKKETAELLCSYEDVISSNKMDLGSTNIVQHDIQTTTDEPIRQSARRIPIHLQTEVKDHVDELVDNGIVSPSTSPWAAPIVTVRKPDGTLRLCVDYRKLNAVTVKDAFPLPRIDTALDNMTGACYFSTLDLTSGYWQVELDNAARAKSAFVTPFGLFEWKSMPFGLCNAPATFQRLMNRVLGELVGECCMVYLDDIVIFSTTVAEHLHHLQLVLQRLRDAGLKVKPSKCHLFRQSVIFLGHQISATGVSPDPSKFAVVQNWPIPKSAKEVKQFVGFVTYYRRFIRNFADIASPLYNLTREHVKFVWSPDCQAVFQQLKQALTSAPILAYPDPSLRFTLDTDASDHGIGSVLSQVTEDGREQVVAYASKSLSKSQKNYSVTKRELLAVVEFCDHFRHYLMGAEFTVRTDHKALLWLKSFKEPTGLLARWIERLSMYDFTFEHRRGSYHANADALSRLPEVSSLCDDQEAADRCSMSRTVSDVDPTSSLSTPVSVNDVDVSDDVQCANDGQIQPNWSDFWTVEEIQRSQSEDLDIDTMLGWVSAFLDRPKRSDPVMKGASLPLLRLWSQWNRLVVVNNILYRKYSSPDSSTEHLQLVIPAKLRPVVLQSLHNDCAGGHLAAEKTLTKVRSRFYWPFMFTDVERHCTNCEFCSSRRNPVPAKKAPMQTRLAGFPLERVAMDILGPLPRTERGNQYIVIVTDYFTKWVEAYSLPDIKAKTVASVFVDGFICRFGTPVSIHTDQGPQFEARLFKEVCAMLDIHKTRTTPYHPSSDGLVERFNRTLEKMLSARVGLNHNDWDLHVQRCLLAYRTSVHSSTKETPCAMMFGRELRLPIDIVFNDSESPVRVPDHMNNLHASLQQSFQHARAAGAVSQKRQKDYYDVRSTIPKFAVGDLVRLHSPVVKPGQCKKFVCPWTGPFKVVTVVDDVVFRVEDCKSGKQQTVHFNRLKKCNGTNSISASPKPTGTASSDRPVLNSSVPIPDIAVDYYQDDVVPQPLVNPLPPQQAAVQHRHQLRNRAGIQAPARFR